MEEGGRRAEEGGRRAEEGGRRAEEGGRRTDANKNAIAFNCEMAIALLTHQFLPSFFLKKTELLTGQFPLLSFFRPPSSFFRPPKRFH
ncbi:MAG: hypothetical protein F6K30_04640 [Cyanothece sp. SIO2G6]|nr:hypothetical protein [Cyanothece sp. SIO2G6]